MTDSWRVVRVEDAVGRRAAHDITMVSNDAKGTLVRRGEVIGEEHVEALRRAGHDLIAVIEPGEGRGDIVWEDEATELIAEAAAGPGCSFRYTGEGKVFITARTDGELRVDDGLMGHINADTGFRVITRRGSSWVNGGDLIGVVELIPLYVPRDDVDELLRTMGPRKVLDVAPPLGLSVGLVVTGTEVYEGRVKELAEGSVRPKVEKYGCRLSRKVVVPDDEARIAAAIEEMAASNDVVIVTGGLSVDPTDFTPRAILATGAKLIIYGFPVKPTTMSMLAYLGEKPIVGISSGVIFFSEENVLDVLLPRICTGGTWDREELSRLGNGGLMQGFIDDVAKRTGSAASDSAQPAAGRTANTST